MSERYWEDHRDCGERACKCPKCETCGHRPEMHDLSRGGCKVITELRHKQREANVLCNCIGGAARG